MKITIPLKGIDEVQKDKNAKNLETSEIYQQCVAAGYAVSPRESFIETEGNLFSNKKVLLKLNYQKNDQGRVYSVTRFALEKP